MKTQVVKFKNKFSKYTILIGDKTINKLPDKIKLLCPKTKNICVFFDKNVPKFYRKILEKKLKKYKIFFIFFSASEKTKSLKTVNNYLNLLLSKNLNRSDLIISMGGGITGDVSGFVASIYKRGINFINIPTTLLAQVDSAIGGKTGVNTTHGKNLVGSFYQPKLVINDTSFIKSLPKKEMICGYAEILKHSIIKDKNFFNWLKKNTKLILSKKSKELTYAIKRSCEIKLFFVNKDVSEKNLRMILNFGHTFAHAIEIKNNYSKISHGEAVLSGMILATKLSVNKKICSKKILSELEEIYKINNLTFAVNRFSKLESVKGLLPYLKHDKKNDDEKINFILLKNIGKTTEPNKHKIRIKDLNKIFINITR